MSKSQNWVMNSGFVNICWSQFKATLTAKCKLLTSAWRTKISWPHFPLPIWCIPIFLFAQMIFLCFVLFWEVLKLLHTTGINTLVFLFILSDYTSFRSKFGRGRPGFTGHHRMPCNLFSDRKGVGATYNNNGCVPVKCFSQSMTIPELRTHTIW